VEEMPLNASGKILKRTLRATPPAAVEPTGTSA
jgi:acyl-coenzyme A synthetase/AMP-(fatty) acid ligase